MDRNLLEWISRAKMPLLFLINYRQISKSVRFRKSN